MNETKRSLIGHHFDAYLNREEEPSDAQMAVAPYLEAIGKDFREKLDAYLEEIEQNAYYAGFSDAMALIMECRGVQKSTYRNVG